MISKPHRPSGLRADMINCGAWVKQVGSFPEPPQTTSPATVQSAGSRSANASTGWPHP